MRKTRQILLASSLLLMIVLALGAQVGPPDDYLFTEMIDVQLVNVEAWVTDAQDRPVTGLTAEDFEILEDGRAVEISHFAEIQNGQPVISGVTRTLVEESAVPAPEPTVQVDPSHLVIYFDELHLSPSGRRQAIEDLVDFLAEGHVPPERVLLLSQDNTLGI